MPVIEIKNVNVTYRVLMNKSSSLKELFRDAIKGKARVVDYVALQDVSFTVDAGEVVAILGRNGAGKSTLLKVLAGVLPPTKGTSKVNGKIAPMIELGAGFHPEMTGAENVLFYSALMGRDIKSVKERTPARTLRRVDLPAPFRPRIAITSPASTVNETSCKAT